MESKYTIYHDNPKGLQWWIWKGETPVIAMDSEADAIAYISLLDKYDALLERTDP